jgi:hypothetical protein
MHNVESKNSRTLIGLTAIVLWIGGCSGGNPGGGPADASIDASIDADDPVAECSQQQRTYVDQIIAPEQQTDVAATVQAVLRTDGFAQNMPFCSGARPAVR